ncbi:MAG: tRNA-dihydrouridine synthase [Phycisphaerales bacterium]|jgi:tRNA-dihydrouridine synthase
MFRIGPLVPATNLLLAPIAGYCDLAFRTICREYGGLGLACTDLLSPQGLLRGTATSLDLAKTNDFDKPIGMQLYGADPEIMAQGARWAVEHGATVVDINMGCPVDKVTKKDGGSKLMTDLSRAVAIAARVVKELEKCPVSREEWGRRARDARNEPRHAALGIRRSSEADASTQATDAESRMPNAGSVVIPLTCKMRLCWSTTDYEGGQACSPHLARLLADVGVTMVTVHGRTTEMKFSGVVQHAGIARVVEEVAGRIPVIGNGDVRTPEDARQMIAKTGCDGVMIGRGALASPWLFRNTWALLSRGEHMAPPSEPEQLATIRRYFDLMRTQRDDRYALFQINRRVSWFAKNLQRELPGGKLESVKPFKEAVRVARAADEIYEALERFGRGELRGPAQQMAETGETL